MQSMQQLLDIMRALRDPTSGCPWDRKQNFQTLIPYTIEEAYEVADAIERNNYDDIKNELGDLLFQIVFYSQLAAEEQAFNFSDVAQSISEKLLRRHPHVFADATVTDAEDQTKSWEKLKQQEREVKAAESSSLLSHLDDVSRTLPSLMRAEKLQKRAAREGFDWPDVKGVVAKIYEELDEVQLELDAENQVHQKLEDEIGDLFFSCINLSRYVGVDAEQSLRKANLKFERRFRVLEKMA
ncbi:MAG: nucleoside triphosphate pyrophosphohydrolase, partial [Gammaproteobacteria bacterium]|nr:nucleoside triphosphate pyrophosphohydrolase [Gammaproteobacteria bacterium]